MSVSRELLRGGWRANEWSRSSWTRSSADACSGRKAASAIRREGASDSRMTPPIEKGIRGWLDVTGGIVGVLLLVQFVTGVLLAFYYVPSVDHAYTTVSYLEKVVSSGAWIRALHHYGSQWLSLFVFLH